MNTNQYPGQQPNQPQYGQRPNQPYPPYGQQNGPQYRQQGQQPNPQYQQRGQYTRPQPGNPYSRQQNEMLSRLQTLLQDRYAECLRRTKSRCTVWVAVRAVVTVLIIAGTIVIGGDPSSFISLIGSLLIAGVFSWAICEGIRWCSILGLVGGIIGTALGLLQLLSTAALIDPRYVFAPLIYGLLILPLIDSLTQAITLGMIVSDKEHAAMCSELQPVKNACKITEKGGLVAPEQMGRYEQLMQQYQQAAGWRQAPWR